MQTIVQKTRLVSLGGLITLCILTAACSKFYWIKSGASAEEFEGKERVCLQETTKNGYGECMQAAGWMRIKSSKPPVDGFRGYPDEHSWAFRP
jgi:hypothetical protein